MCANTTNRLLLSLSPELRTSVINRSHPMDLPLRHSLFEAERTPDYAYFMTSGMASIVTEMEDGGTAEVGIIGEEGIVGGIHILGPAKVSTTAFIQLAGTGLRIPLNDLRRFFRTSPEFHDRFLEFYQEQSLTVSQIAGCNRLHEAEERLARWLLMAQGPYAIRRYVLHTRVPRNDARVSTNNGHSDRWCIAEG